jgi:hypothetical protein
MNGPSHHWVSLRFQLPEGKGNVGIGFQEEETPVTVARTLSHQRIDSLDAFLRFLPVLTNDTEASIVHQARIQPHVCFTVSSY